jgi:hypothetical protein
MRMKYGREVDAGHRLPAAAGLRSCKQVHRQGWERVAVLVHALPMGNTGAGHAETKDSRRCTTYVFNAPIR